MSQVFFCFVGETVRNSLNTKYRNISNGAIYICGEGIKKVVEKMLHLHNA